MKRTKTKHLKDCSVFYMMRYSHKMPLILTSDYPIAVNHDLADRMEPLCENIDGYLQTEYSRNAILVLYDSANLSKVSTSDLLSAEELARLIGLNELSRQIVSVIASNTANWRLNAFYLGACAMLVFTHCFR